ncbi:glycoside hydrolase family 3 N-terminal domain-containing protein [Clostridium sp. AL.422]|uniref:glycoside hydrolase family 3 protein n=1 Tax=Clostridium TaxID=1485 RepID=UPI00293DAE68|nr:MULTISPECIES: glycoside hydrolase family 3 N-terminal domain-containing protein [unclassified Clostridium]MDV4152655.1 glycoside hydrolase family 3 N-terminal domain-containing protein [Clostridium sp. AL.422]
MKKLVLVFSIILLFIVSFFIGYKYSDSRKTNEPPTGEDNSDSIIDNDNSNNPDDNSNTPDNPSTEDSNLVKAKELLFNMSLEEKVGQMFLIRCNSETALDDINKYKVGGFILFDANIQGETKDSLSSTIKLYQENSNINMIMAIDEEGGIVNRLSWYPEFRAVPFYSPQDLYNEGGYPLIISDTKEKAELLNSIGINMNLAPVCDISTDPNDYIYPRTFGKSADETATYIRTVVETMQKNNMGSALKHFPGYGSNLDTHSGMSVDNRSYESFINNDFIPFKAGIDAGADSILVSHNIISSIDETLPASLSKPVHDIIRNDLGFDGVIMTDDLQMDAIKEYIGEVNSVIFAVNAGNDLIISSDYNIQIPTVIEAVNNGDIKEEVINEAVLRVLQLKLKLNII